MFLTQAVLKSRPHCIGIHFIECTETLKGSAEHVLNSYFLLSTRKLKPEYDYIKFQKLGFSTELTTSILHNKIDMIQYIFKLQQKDAPANPFSSGIQEDILLCKTVRLSKTFSSCK